MNLGLKRGTVQVVPYDPAWHVLYLEEKARLEQALGNKVGAIEHIGSTSVPGLIAKPIIDMIAAVDNLANYQQFIEPLTKLGYEFMPERVFADRVFFPKGPRNNRTFHLSLVVKDGPGWHEPLCFRDYLIAHPEKRQAYQALKERLAEQYPNDRASYTQAKAAFIEHALQEVS